MPVGRWNGETWGAGDAVSGCVSPDKLPDRVSPRWCGEAESNRRAGHGSEPARDLPPRVGAIHESPAFCFLPPAAAARFPPPGRVRRALTGRYAEPASGRRGGMGTILVRV